MPPAARYHAEARHALAELQRHLRAGNLPAADRWHAAWSAAEAACRAEALRPGSGRHAARSAPLLPLPADLAALRAAPAPAPEPPDPEPPFPPPPPLPPPVPAAPGPALVEALARHRRIEAALRTHGPNPLPDTLTPDDWENALDEYELDGPTQCRLLTDAEACVETLADGVPPPADAALRECLDTALAALPDLTDEEIEADAAEALRSARPELAALLTEELAVRARLA